MDQLDGQTDGFFPPGGLQVKPQVEDGRISILLTGFRPLAPLHYPGISTGCG